MQPHRVVYGGKILDTPRSVSDLGAASSANREEDGELDGDECGAKKEKMRALSSLDSNKVVKRSSTPTKHSSLKVVLDLTAPETGNLSLAKENKENMEDTGSNCTLAHKGIKHSCPILEENSGCDNDSNMASKRRKKTVDSSPSQSADATMKYQEGELPLFPKKPNQNENLGTLKSCLRTSLSGTLQNSCTSDTPSVPSSSFKENITSSFVPSEVNVLPLFEFCDSSKTSGEEIVQHDNVGLSMLGATAFLSLGLDETSHNKPCSLTDNATSHRISDQPPQGLGADLTLGLPMNVVAKSQGIENKIGSRGKDALSLDMFFVSRGNLLEKHVDFCHSAADNELTAFHSQKQDETGNLLETSQDFELVDTPTDLDKLGKQGLAESQLQSEVPKCSSNTVPQIIDDCLSQKDTGDEQFVGHMGPRKDYMNYSDLPIPLRGTLLLPRGQKRARKLPIPFKRLKTEILQQKKEVSKKEKVSKFSRVSAPSGLLADLNPGIIGRVRNSKQVHAIIEAVVGPDALTTYQDGKQNIYEEPKMNAEQGIFGVSHTVATVDNDDSEVVDTHHRGNAALDRHEHCNGSQGLKWKLQERITTTMDTFVAAQLGCKERPLDISLSQEAFEYVDAKANSFPATEYNRNQLCMKHVTGEYYNTKGSFICHCHYCRPGESSSIDSTCSAALSIKAATMASHWLELYYQDVKGRLAALKRSRKRVRAVIKDVFGYTSDHSSNSHENKKVFVQVPKIDQHANILANAEHDHMEKWRSLFLHMDKRLNTEGAQLEISLEQIKEMQGHCKWGLEVNRPDSHQDQQPEPLGDRLRTNIAPSKTIEKQYAVGAAAASIYSTANFVTSTTAEDVPCF